MIIWPAASRGSIHARRSQAPKNTRLASFLLWPLLLCLCAYSFGADNEPVKPPVKPYVSNTPISDLPQERGDDSSPPLKTGGPDIVPQHTPKTEDALRPLASSAIGLALTPLEFAVANPNFEGIDTNGQPPDTTGAVGANHYIQIVNRSNFSIWDKQGNFLANNNMQQLWTDAGAPANDDCRVRGRGDPYVIYDHLADRWVLSQFANKTTAVGDPLQIQCIAVSIGPDPVNDGWYVYTFDLGFSNDYPKLAVWPDGYYMVSQRGYNGNAVDVTVFDRATMLNGGAATFQTRTGSGGSPTIIQLPSELEGTPPPAGTPNYYVRMIDCDLFAGQGPCPGVGGPDLIEVREFSVDWAVPANTTFGNVTQLFPADFNSAICDGANLFNNCIDQPGGGTDKEALSVWPMAPANYRNFGSHESLVFNHTVNVDGNGLAGVRWYELRRSGGAWSIYQQGTFSPPDGNQVHRWMGSIGMDQAGNIALGYSVSNDGDNGVTLPNVFPGIRYTGRLATDPLGLLPFGENVMVNGATSTAGTRWGDYSAMRVDPVDGCTFWYTTQWNDTDGQTTQIGAFRFPSCNPVDLSISKSASPDPAIAGAQLFYDITVTNNGPSIATEVAVMDTLPAGVSYVTDTAGCVEGPVGTLTCELENIDPGDSTFFQIKVLVDADLVANEGGPTAITNFASVSSNEDDTNTADNETELTTIVDDLADLAVTKLCKPDGPLLAGQTAVCEIFVDNLGPSAARDVLLVDTHVAEGPFTIVSAPGCNIVGNVVTCDLGTLSADAPNNRSTVTISLTADDAVDINNLAVVSSATDDPNNANNSAEDGVSVTAVADLGLTKSDAPDPVVAGELLTYELTVSNNGPSTAVNALIEDNLPMGVSVNSVNAPGGTCNAGVPGDPTQPTQCNFDSLADGASGTMTIVVTVLPDTEGILHNDAEVSSDTFDDNNANNLASTDTQVGADAELVVDKVDSPDPVAAGAPLTYTILVTNNGPSTALDVMLTDNLPAEVSFDSANATNGGPCNLVQIGVVECELGDLDPGKNVTVYINVTVDPATPDGTTISNEVSLASPTSIAGASDSEDTLVNAAADLWIDKTANFPTGNPSGTLEYQITVHNDAGCSSDDPQVCGDGGPSDAQNVVVVDPLPLTSKKLRVEFVSEDCVYDEGAHTVTCTTTTLPADSNVLHIIQMDVKGKSVEVENTATVTSDTTDPDSSNNTDTVLTSVKGGKGDSGGPNK